MAIRILRSQTTATPSSLDEGQLAYSEQSGNLFIGTSGSSVTKIGGNTDVTKLAGIEASADVTDEANVTAAFPISDATELLYDPADNTKKLRIDVGAVATGTTRVITMPNGDLTLVGDSEVVHNTGDESIGGNKTFDNNVIVTGNLTVNGTTTTVNSNEVDIGDNIIKLNSDETGTPSQDAGFEIERGTSTNARMQWNETTDSWEAGLAGSEAALILSGGNISDLTNDSGYLTSESNDLSAAVTWANVPDANITESSVTQHVAALDHDSLLNFVANEHIDWTVTGAEDVHADRISEGSVTQHQAALSITESQISDLDHTDADAIHDNVAGEINAVSEKATPASADLLIIEDSADSNNKKKVQIGNLPGVADTFVELTDTPANFTSSGGFFVKVNSGETALEFVEDVDDGTF